ncbi:MAG: hypothetical protein KGY41_06340 [Desulfovermiculus sp.]|nr:hypothetical protein [Desulfovermiculus sp.]
MTGGTYKALAGRIGQLVRDIQRVVHRIELLHNKAQQTGDNGYQDGVALNLHSFYAGFEAVFEDIGRTIDHALPAGGNWHQELLQQMAAQLEDLRPAVISQDTRICLDEYRAFRHLVRKVRNVYTFNLRPSRVDELAEGVQECFALISRDLEDFMRFLKAAE